MNAALEPPGLDVAGSWFRATAFNSGQGQNLRFAKICLTVHGIKLEVKVGIFVSISLTLDQVCPGGEHVELVDVLFSYCIFRVVRRRSFSARRLCIRVRSYDIGEMVYAQPILAISHDLKVGLLY